MLEMDFVMIKIIMQAVYLMVVTAVDLMSIPNIAHYVYAMKI